MRNLWCLNANSNKSLQTETDTDFFIAPAPTCRTMANIVPRVSYVELNHTGNVKQIRILLWVSTTKMDAKGGEVQC